MLSLRIRLTVLSALFAASAIPAQQPHSKRLLHDLKHPADKKFITQVEFTPDGSRIVAANYPDGAIQVWEVATGKALAKIETGYELRGGSKYFHISPDGNSIIVAQSTRKIVNVNINGKPDRRWEFDGRLSQWELKTGSKVATFAMPVGRDVFATRLSSDGRVLVSSAFLPDLVVNQKVSRTTVWSLDSTQSRDLPHNTGYATISNDSRSIAVTTLKDGLEDTVRLFDAATLEEKWNLRFQDALSDRDSFHPVVFSPDSRRLIVYKQRVEPVPPQKSFHVRIEVVDAEHGRVVGSFDNPPSSSHLSCATFFPNGARLAIGATSHIDELHRVFILDMPTGKKSHEIALPKGHRFRDLTISPDGKLLAILSQEFPQGNASEEPANWPPAEVRIVETASGRIRDVLSLPAGSSSTRRFNPNGQILATGGQGRVSLWDFAGSPQASK